MIFINAYVRYILSNQKKNDILHGIIISEYPTRELFRSDRKKLLNVILFAMTELLRFQGVEYITFDDLSRYRRISNNRYQHMLKTHYENTNSILRKRNLENTPDESEANKKLKV
jgi:hypothetical protein